MSIRLSPSVLPESQITWRLNLIRVHSPSLAAKNTNLQSKSQIWQQIRFHTPSACGGVPLILWNITSIQMRSWKNWPKTVKQKRMARFLRAVVRFTQN